MPGTSVDRRRRLGVTGTALVLLALVAGGCAPGTPDGDSWRIDAQRSVSDASSAVHAAELALRMDVEDRVFDHYLQTVLVESEEAVGAAGDAIGSEQPPRAEQERYAALTGQLDEAQGLLSTVRIAVVDREEDRYAALADRLADAGSALLQLEDDLQHPPQQAAG